MLDVALVDALLTYLRRSLSGDVRFAEPPIALTGGFDTTIVAFQLANAPDDFSASLVLRLMPSQDDGPRVARECAAHAALTASGFPAPRVLLHSREASDLGAPFLIMNRLPGRNFWDNAFGPNGKRSRIFDLTSVLAETHANLHSVDPQQYIAALTDNGLNPGDFTVLGEIRRIAERVERMNLAALKPGVAWLLANMPPPANPPAICHGDFHPLNLVMDGDQLSGVVDWSQTVVGDPAYDVACTTILLRFGPVEASGVVRVLFDRVRSLPIRRYSGFYKSHRELDLTDFAYYECVRTISALTFANERERNPWSEPRTLAALRHHFQKRAGVSVGS